MLLRSGGRGEHHRTEGCPHQNKARRAAAAAARPKVAGAAVAAPARRAGALEEAGRAHQRGTVAVRAAQVDWRSLIRAAPTPSARPRTWPVAEVEVPALPAPRGRARPTGMQQSPLPTRHRHRPARRVEAAPPEVEARLACAHRAGVCRRSRSRHHRSVAFRLLLSAALL